MNVVLVSDFPPVGPSAVPMTCNSRQSIALPFGQLESVPAVTKLSLLSFWAHTLLLSKELCHVASPKRDGFGPIPLGFSTGLRKWVMIWTASPKIFAKSVASGRALFTVHEAPVPLGKQT